MVCLLENERRGRTLHTSPFGLHPTNVRWSKHAEIRVFALLAVLLLTDVIADSAGTSTGHLAVEVAATAFAVGAALELVSPIETKLGLDAVSPPIALKLVRAVSRVSAEALAIAAGIVSSDPERFHDFDATVIGDAAEQVRVLTPVLERAEALVHDLQKSLYQRRQQGAQQTRALDATLQRLRRLVGNGQLSAQVEKLSAALPAATQPA